MTKYFAGLIMVAVAGAWIGFTALSAWGAPPVDRSRIDSREVVSARSNPYYSAILSWRWSLGQCCDSFLLHVVNNTNKPLEILWDKTFFVHNGTRDGGFVFGQRACNYTDLPRASSIPPGGSFETEVWPEVLVHSQTSPQTCSHSFLERGRDGIFLTIKGDGVKMRETITLDLDFEHLLPQIVSERDGPV